MKRLALVIVCALLCTANAGQWKMITPLNFATICIDVSFSGEDDGLAPLAKNGLGSFVARSVDGGHDWYNVQAPQVPFWLSGAAAGDQAVLSALFGLYVGSKKGSEYNFTQAKLIDEFAITSQSVEANGPNFFAATGQSLSGTNGVAVSLDGGYSFNFHNVSNMTAAARYGAFPTRDTWYIAAGNFPTLATSRNAFTFSERVHIERTGFGYKPALQHNHMLKDYSSGYLAQISKTTNGGKSWTTQFVDDGFYFNQIDCSPADPNHCCVAGESSGREKPGVRIYCTRNGGARWELKMHATNPGLSIVPLKFVSDSEIWAAGAEFSRTITGVFWHSMDGGNTWTNETMPYVYPMTLDFPSSRVGYGAAVNIENDSCLLKYM